MYIVDWWTGLRDLWAELETAFKQFSISFSIGDTITELQLL